MKKYISPGFSLLIFALCFAYAAWNLVAQLSAESIDWRSVTYYALFALLNGFLTLGAWSNLQDVRKGIEDEASVQDENQILSPWAASSWRTLIGVSCRVFIAIFLYKYLIIFLKREDLAFGELFLQTSVLTAIFAVGTFLTILYQRRKHKKK